MASNKAIQVLRGSSSAIASSTETLLYGQLLYNLDKSYLTVGGGANGNALNESPITCRELIGYAEDDSGITANKTTEYGGSVYGW